MAKNSGNNIDGCVKFVVTDKNVYEGESVIIDLVLIGYDKDIAGINRVSYPDFDGLEWQEISLNRRLDETDYSDYADSKKSVIPVARYLVKTSKAGEFVIDPGKIVAEIYSHETYVDPFWGTRYRKKKTVPVDSKTTKLKVNRVPEDVKKKNLPVGDYEARWILPPGEIVPGQDGILILRIEGNGDLRKSELPELLAAFPDNMRFVGMTPDIDVYLKNGKVFSTAQLVCTFTASEAGDYMLRPFDFRFFSSNGKKIRTVIVEPIKIQIQNSKKDSRQLRFEQI